jgi:galactose-1-phosphate uridylyltransferase
VFTQLSFPQGCFRQHDITGWLNATARDAADIMLVSNRSPIRILQYIPPYVYYNVFPHTFTTIYSP